MYFIKWFKNLGRADNLYMSIQPLIFCSFLSGLTPICVGREYLETSRLGYIITLLHAAAFLSCFVCSIQKQQSIIGYFFKTDISAIGDTIHMLANPIVVISLLAYSLWDMNTMIDVFNTLHVIDKKLAFLGIKINYNIILRKSYFILVILFIFNFGYVVGSYTLLIVAGVKPSLDVFFTFCVPHVEICTIVFIFVCTIALIDFRFLKINEILKNMLQDIQNTQNFSTTDLDVSTFHLDKFTRFSATKLSPSIVISEVTNIHNLLHDTCRLGEKFFSYQMLVIIAVSFLFIIFDDYYVLDLLLSKNSLNTNFDVLTFVIFLLGQMVLYAVMIIAVVEGSSRTIAQNDKIAISVHKLLQKTNNKDLENKLLQFSMQLMHRKVRFTAAGLFNLDRTFIFTMSGAVTTYLIILLQFRTSGTTSLFDGCTLSTNSTESQ